MLLDENAYKVGLQDELEALRKSGVLDTGIDVQEKIRVKEELGTASHK